jgi:hypothetical protein
MTDDDRPAPGGGVMENQLRAALERHHERMECSRCLVDHGPHVPDALYHGGYCKTCVSDWPCYAARALPKLDAAESRVAALEAGLRDVLAAYNEETMQPLADLLTPEFLAGLQVLLADHSSANQDNHQ